MSSSKWDALESGSKWESIGQEPIAFSLKNEHNPEQTSAFGSESPEGRRRPSLPESSQNSSQIGKENDEERRKMLREIEVIICLTFELIE